MRNINGNHTVTDRRHFLSTLATITACSTLPHFSCDSPDKRGTSDLYIPTADTLKSLTQKKKEAFRDGANLIATTIIARNRCFFHTSNVFLDRFLRRHDSGLPKVFIPLITSEMASTVQEGDCLVTTHAGEIPDIARDNGARIIVITVSDTTDNKSGTETRTGDNNPDRYHADVSIEAHLSSGTSAQDTAGALYNRPLFAAPSYMAITTALAAETYRRSGGIGLTDDSAPGDALFFLTSLRDRMLALNQQQEAFSAAFDMISRGIAEGGRVKVYDTGGILTGDENGASEYMEHIDMVSRETIHSGTINTTDTIIMTSLISNKPADITLMRNIRQTTDRTLSICPHDGVGGYRLFKETAAGLDNLSPEHDGIIAFDYDTRHFCTTGHIMNTVMVLTLANHILSS